MPHVSGLISSWWSSWRHSLGWKGKCFLRDCFKKMDHHSDVIEDTSNDTMFLTIYWLRTILSFFCYPPRWHDFFMHRRHETLDASAVISSDVMGRVIPALSASKFEMCHHVSEPQLIWPAPSLSGIKEPTMDQHWRLAAYFSNSSKANFFKRGKLTFLIANPSKSKMIINRAYGQVALADRPKRNCAQV